MENFRNKNIKDLCESYEKQYNIRKEREELIAKVYRYFYDCKNKMIAKDNVSAYISGITSNNCIVSFYYKTGVYDNYRDTHKAICSIYIYTTDYKEIKIKGNIALNSYKNMFIDASINENNYKSMLYILNEYIEDITTTIAGGDTVTCDILIMDNEKIKEIDNMKKEEELKDQYNKIVYAVNSIKDKLFIQLLSYELSKSINFDILGSEKDNSVRFIITDDFTHLPIADVNITMNGLNNIDIDSIHCNDIEELGNELDNIIVNVSSTIGKVRDNIYNIEFRQIKDFVWNLNNMILKDEEFKIETIYHNCKDMIKIEFLINHLNKNNFIVVEKIEGYRFLVKYELFGLSTYARFAKNDEVNSYIQTLYEKIKHVVKSLG